MRTRCRCIETGSETESWDGQLDVLIVCLERPFQTILTIEPSSKYYHSLAVLKEPVVLW